MLKTMRSMKFLVKGPLILGLLFVINLMTSPGEWWVQWAALGIGIAWVISLFRVLRAVVLMGGLAALGALILRSRDTQPQAPGLPPFPDTRHRSVTDRQPAIC